MTAGTNENTRKPQPISLEIQPQLIVNTKQAA